MRTMKQTTNGLQERRDTSLVTSSSGRAKADDAKVSKPVRQSRRENTRDGARPNVGKHTVFVIGADGKPLTPTTSAKARKLLKGGVAEKCWSRFGTFGIKMLIETRKEVPKTSFGIDFGTKFEGYAVVCGDENSLAVKLDLPNKKETVRKLEERRNLRRARRHRNCRRRASRFSNRVKRTGWLAPSQAVIVNSRLKIIRELLRIYPVSLVGLEDVRFNHAKHRWGANFSTVEIGKARIREEFSGLEVFEFAGYQTQQLRKKYGYRKTKVKSADKFEAHCTDALALACETGPLKRVKLGRLIVVDDSYRPVRRRLHDTQPAEGGIRDAYSRGTVFGVQKGTLIEAANGKVGRLCGESNGKYRYYDRLGKRQATRGLAWISRNFVVRKDGASPVA